MGENPLRELHRLGQSVWYDNIRRGEILSGDLKRLIDEDGLSGVTSNPSIFEKAIGGSKDYDSALRKLVDAGREAPQIFESLAVEDIRMAADLFRPIYDSTQGRDGLVSIEVSPTLAHDTARTVVEARRLWRTVNRPNIMVKIPGTPEGVPAIEQTLDEGLNINITLLFGVERYEEVANAYLVALEKRAKRGEPLDRVASVASFFVSRIDTLIDQRLEARLRAAGTPAEREKIERLKGKVAIANAKAAYEKFKALFSSARFQALTEKGARAQRVLWASTSTKNPKYRDVLYVEELVGADSVTTLPAATVVAFRDHGRPRVTIEENLDEAHATLKQLAGAGVDLRAATKELEEQGVENFARDFEKLLKVIGERREQILAGTLDRVTASLGKTSLAVEATLAKLDDQKFSMRFWDRDAAVWKQDPAAQRIIRNSLGWLSVSHSMLEHLDEVLGFVDEVKRAGFKSAVVLGMGGSSLCPDVCRETFGAAPGYLQLHVLDSTVPESVLKLEKGLDLARTLFLVSSKSGGTTETLTFYRYFRNKLEPAKGQRSGENFIAITDPGTSLEKLAREAGFRRVFHGHADIGGRYSALSNFGMVPAALAGVDVRALLERAERMVHACACCVPPEDNPGISLGVMLAEAARSGRDKVTFFLSPGIRSFGDWVEQLIAESTGKEGKGLVPVVGEGIGEPAAYGNDRLFIHIQLASEAQEKVERRIGALEKQGHPVIRFDLENKLDLGQEFFRWEVATATAGALLGINAFDQPNVQESKDNTNRLLAEFRSKGKLAEEPPSAEAQGLGLYLDAETRARAEHGSAPAALAREALEDYLSGFLRQAKPGDYLALMAYLEPSSAVGALQAIRARLRDGLRLATTLGFGPRFLHSTGQLHKGGPNSGLFIQITAEDREPLNIPGEPYTFSVLKQAQAIGDFQSLESKKRRVARVHLGKDVPAGLGRLAALVETVLDGKRASGAQG